MTAPCLNPNAAQIAAGERFQTGNIIFEGGYSPVVRDAEGHPRMMPVTSILNNNPEVSENIRAFYRDWETDRKSTRLNSSHSAKSRMPSSA